VTANFTRRHAPPQDDLVVRCRSGQAVAEISGDQSSSRYEPAWPTVAARKRRLTGSPSARWARPCPSGLVGVDRRDAAPGRSVFGRLDASGRATVLRQDGWEIVYAYAADDPRLPSRLQLTQGDLEIRIVVIKRR
jgi:hypothetical protein